MSKRLQVVMDDAEYQEIQEAAATHRLTTSAWVRAALREARQRPDGPSGGASSTTTSAPMPAGEAGAGLTHDDRTLVEAVVRLHGFTSAQEAIRYALRRAADPPMLREEMMELRGMGWSGDLDRLR